MSKRYETLIIALIVLGITSVTSHVVAWKCHLLTEVMPPLKFGKADAPGTAVATGSSLTFYGIAWSEVAEAMRVKVVGLTCPLASASEMEVLERRAPAAQCTFVGISIFDSDENCLSDHHAQVVPLHEEVADLWSARVDWTHSKRALSQYPMTYIQMIYPTAGESRSLMVRVREKLRMLSHRTPEAAVSEGAVITDKGNSHLDSIKTWSVARMDRNIADVRSNLKGKPEFDGTKRQALFRLLRRSAGRGKVVVVVMPESPIFESEFVTTDVKERFEGLVAEAQKRVPEALWVRLDGRPELKDGKYYWDLVHLNAYGQAIATKALVNRLAAAGIQ
ncbi:MAG TPA: hypothetical protein VLZ30_04770 [Verrucomicrobiae bacterium]|nr:hypothetical protein [Verrucomicrobiae bacterium]